MLRAQAPVASFTASSDSGCAPLLVTFSNNSTGAAGYLWRFGNGNISTLSQPSSSYTAAGTYTVTLVAISANGLRDSMSMVITVLGNPNAGFSANSATPCDDYNAYAFTNLSSGAISYLWDFGDGSGSSLNSPTHTYSSPGNYTVKLVATNSFGCQDIEIRTAYITVLPNPIASISVSQSSSCDVNTVFQFNGSTANAASWFWNFGDGSTSALPDPTHQYAAPGSYPVTLIVTSADGCSDTVQAQNQISIGNSLVPSFTVSDSAGCAPHTVQFDCTVAGATTWLWNFGDGTTSTLDNPQHTYINPGTFSVTLTVTTQIGCNGSVSAPALITADAKPMANFTVVQDSGCAPFTPQFINASTGAGSCFWQFSTGDTSSAFVPGIALNTAGLIDVTLTVISPNGCRDSLKRTRLLRVFNPGANFSGFPLTGCPGMNVQFSYQGSVPLTTAWLWNFGDGTFSTLQAPSHTYTAIGNYTVSLIITNIFGCRDTVIQPNYIRVVNGQTVFGPPDTIRVCLGDLLGLSDPTTGSNSWLWNFGNGSGSTSQSPSVLYTDTGTYTVTLQTAMPGGCTQTFNPYAIVRVIPYDPRPIYIGYLGSCKPYSVSFSTQTPDVTHYLWNFGDGTTSTLPNPTHTYTQAGTYPISLTLTIGEGCVTTLDTTITLGYQNPATASTYDACKNAPVSFAVNNTRAFVSARWLFGDGQSAAGFSVTHSYADSGTYTVILITTDNMGCTDTFTLQPSILISDPVPQFSLPATLCLYDSLHIQNQSTQAGSFLWHFGDGITSGDENPSHLYSTTGYYSIRLDAIQNGCSVSLLRDSALLVTQPVADFRYQTTGMCMPLQVNFTDQSTGATQWNWLFGDGSTSAQQNPTHLYTNDLSDSLRLVVTDAYGCIDTGVQAAFPYYRAAAGVSHTSGCTPLQVQFSDNSNGAISWLWDFGNGYTSGQQNPSHTYTAGGLYDIQLIATFPGGCVDTINYPQMINASEPLAGFYSPTIAGCSPTQISFQNTSNDATQFEWLFGDGGSSTQVNPQHIYYIPGTYSITLIVTNSYGCSDTLTRPDYISIPGTYTYFSLPSTDGCQGSAISFTDSSVNASAWTWDFGNGILDTLQHPRYIYNDTGTYFISLITRDSIGCTSSFTYPDPIRIHPLPTALATISDTIGCNSFTTSFINLSQGAVSYFWWLGNGQTSQQNNPVHTYLQAGIYYPQLEATSAFGCKDTFDFSTAVNVLSTPIAEITASDTIACAPAGISFSSQMSSVQNPAYSWHSGNGQSGSSANFSAVYAADSTYMASLIITNDNGCSDTDSVAITVHPSPSADFSADTMSGCTPLSVRFIPADTTAISYSWNFGQGQNATQQLPATVYDSAGIYTPALWVENSFGCRDSFRLTPGIEALQTPVADFTSDKVQACFGDQVNFTNQSSGLIQAAWQWYIGNQTSTSQHAVYNAAEAGFIGATLIVINANGCSDTMSINNYLEVYDTLPPPASPIRSVSVIDDNHIRITWANGSDNDIVAYLIYRFNPASGNWINVHTDTMPALAPASPLSTWTDTGLNTLQNTYTYKIETIDYCGYKTAFGDLVAHTSTELKAKANGLQIRLDWTPYGGCDPGGYELYRTERKGGQAIRIARVDSATLSFTDTTLQCPFEYEYRIRALSLCGLPFEAWSDTAAAWPENIFEGQQSEIIRTTVTNNRNTLTEWLPPEVLPERVAEYHILRSSDGINFTHIGTVNAGTQRYTDIEADVHQNSYTYRVLVINDCGLAGSEKNTGKSILLQGDRQERTTTLTWSQYEDWDTGVEYYEIEYLLPSGVWEKIKRVNGQQAAVEIND